MCSKLSGTPRPKLTRPHEHEIRAHEGERERLCQREAYTLRPTDRSDRVSHLLDERRKHSKAPTSVAPKASGEVGGRQGVEGIAFSFGHRIEALNKRPNSTEAFVALCTFYEIAMHRLPDFAVGRLGHQEVLAIRLRVLEQSVG